MDMLIPIAAPFPGVCEAVGPREGGGGALQTPHGSSSGRVLASTLSFRIGTLDIFSLRHTVGWGNQCRQWVMLKEKVIPGR